MDIKSLVSPLNDEPFSVLVEPLDLDASFAIQSARGAANAWNRMGYVARGALLKKVCRELEAQREEFAQILRTETGKPLELAYGEIDAADEVLAFHKLDAENIVRVVQEVASS
jgi:aldehyde dehydrogenase (NAD+)